MQACVRCGWEMKAELAQGFASASKCFLYVEGQPVCSDCWSPEDGEKKVKKMEGYEAKDVHCEFGICTGDTELAVEAAVSNQAILELLAAVFPRIKERIDAISEIRLTVKVREV